MATTKANILVVDDDHDILETARMFLKQVFTSVDITPDPSKIPEMISRTSYDIILLDMNFRKGRNDGEEGFYWLDRILEYDPDAVVVLITAYGEVELAVRAVKEGALDFILKPWKNEKLLSTVLSGLKLRRSRKKVQRLEEVNSRMRGAAANGHNVLVGNSPAMKRIMELIEKVAPTDANVLLLGENGTGKNVIANLIHRASKRSKQPFINVDVGAIPETLFESELFGHVAGAFTDAKSDRAGSFELASEGTILLDEIGNIPPSLQTKLLTVLEERKIKRVGSNEEIDVDVRLITATNQPIHQRVEASEFRQDLLYRINTVEIVIPPLRERKTDIPELLEFFNERFSKKYQKQNLEIEKETIQRLADYPWPGNVRELSHMVERAVILSDPNALTPQVETSHLADPFETPKTLEGMEKQFILKSLEENGGNVTVTAKVLGLTRTALYRRLNKHGIL